MMTRLRQELGLVLIFLRRGGGPRAVLVAASTAIVSGLLLVALTVALFTWKSSGEEEQLGNLVADPGVRGGYVFALLLICVAPLALLRQVVRLGTASRERRLAALRLAGATPGEVRRLGALEVGIPALLGGLVGYLVFVFLRLLFGGLPLHNHAFMADTSAARRELRLVPVTVGPTWWQVLLVALVVGLIGILAGSMGSRSVVVSPLGVSRRSPSTVPKPWGLAFLAAAAVLARLTFTPSANALVPFACVACVIVGLLLLAPVVAYWLARAVAARARQPHVLMAARRLVHDPRPAGRAAAAVGAISLVAGGGGSLLADLPNSQGGSFDQVNPIYTVPIALAGVVLLLALILVLFSMTVHGVETLMDRKRSIASLAALGASLDELERVQRWEVGLVALPMGILGVVVGSGVFLPYLLSNDPAYAWIPVVVDAATIVVGAIAVRASARLTRPWLTRSVAASNLRTE
jgi:hypothetical protein